MFTEEQKFLFDEVKFIIFFFYIVFLFFPKKILSILRFAKIISVFSSTHFIIQLLHLVCDPFQVKLYWYAVKSKLFSIFIRNFFCTTCFIDARIIHLYTCFLPRLHSPELYDYPDANAMLSLLPQLYYKSCCHVVKPSKCAPLVQYCFSTSSVFQLGKFYIYISLKAFWDFDFDFINLEVNLSRSAT